jgi:hypothetical protein
MIMRTEETDHPSWLIEVRAPYIKNKLQQPALLEFVF